MAPSTNLVSGTYVNSKTQEYVDFLLKRGISSDAAKKMLNTTWTTVVKELPCGSYLSRWSCKEHPEMNGSETYALGTSFAMDTAFYGGKAKVAVYLKEDNTFECVADTENMGKFTWSKTYVPEGLWIEYPNGEELIKEFWERQYSIEGWYELDRTENVEGYLKAAGMDSSMKSAFEGIRLCYKAKNDGYELLEQFQQSSVLCHFLRFDEEFDYKIPDAPALNGKALVTRVNGHSVKFTLKKDSGVVDEWIGKFCPLGALLLGRVVGSDRETSTVKCYYKRFHNPFGQFKMVAEVGMKDFLVGMGVPEAAAKAFSEEKDFKISLEDKGDGLVHYVATSKIQPQDMMIKFGEEFEMKTPLLPGVTMKGVTTMEGDTLVSVVKSPKGTMKSSFKLGNTFCVSETCLVDTGVKYKAIFERV